MRRNLEGPDIMQKLPNLEPGKFYHIYNRGINRQNIFLSRAITITL